MHVENPYIQYMYSYPHKTAYRPLEKKTVFIFISLSASINVATAIYFLLPGSQSNLWRNM